MASSYGVCTTGTRRKAEKIDITFEDQIKHTKNFRISFFPWVRIDQLKKQLARERYNDHLSWSDIRLFFKNIELLPNNKRCFDFGVDLDSTFVIKNVEPNRQLQRGIVNPYQIFDQVPPKIKDLILEVQSGLNNGRNPKLTQQGTSGTYFLENHLKKTVAIFKPFNQEPYADENPRGYIGQNGIQGIRKGILSGQSATRQVAAYLLDQNRFHGVPETTYVEFFHPSFIKKGEVKHYPIPSDPEKTLNKQSQLKTKHGSLQAFKQSHDIVGNMGSNQFDVEQIHRIGILDLRILNCDRNEANILVQKKTVFLTQQNKKKVVLKLIPIDHGLCFPDNFEIYDEEIVWMGYRQSSKPFSQKSLNFIANIDPVKDCQQLRRKLGFREICLRNFRISQIFLKKAAAACFTLHQIGEMMFRKDQDLSDLEEELKNKKNQNLSDLEKLVQYAENTYLLVKQNGIKSTINFQLNFVKPKKKEESLPELPEQTLRARKVLSKVEKPQQIIKTSLEKSSKIQSKQQQSEEEYYQNQLKKNFQEKVIQRKVSKRQSSRISPNKTRNVSLPNLKIKEKPIKGKSELNKKFRKQRREDNRAGVRANRQKQWDEVFFHYFEDFADRFMQEKKKKMGNPLGSRNRLMSEDINYQF